MTTTSLPQSTPTLYSFGVLSVLPGQTITLKGLTNKTLTQGSWTVSFRVRLKAPGTSSKLLTLGPTTSLFLGTAVSSSTPHNNHVYAAFKKHSGDDTTTKVDSQCELKVGVWYNLTMTVQKVSSNSANIVIYTDAAPFGAPGTATPVHISTYGACTDSSTPKLGGNVHAEFMNISFWNSTLDQTNISQNAFQDATILPAHAQLLKSYDFSTLVNNTSLFTLSKGAQLLCVNNATQFGNGVVVPDPLDGLNPGGNLTLPFTVQAAIYSIPPISNTDQLMSPIILSNGALEDSKTFALGVQYNADLQTFKLMVRFPDHPNAFVDTTSLSTHTWNTVAVTWDGANLHFYVNGVPSSQYALTHASPRTSGAVCIGALASSASVSGFTQFFLGQLQGVGVWDRALSASELANFQTPAPDSRDGLVGHFDLTSTEFANQVTGRRLALKGTIFVQETSTINFMAATARAQQPPLNPQLEDYCNLTLLQEENANVPTSARALQVDPATPLKSSKVSAAQVDKLAKGVDFYAQLVPEAQREEYRQLWDRNLRTALDRLERAGDVVPGAFTSKLEGDTWVTHFHTPRGLVEVNRSAAQTVSACTTWKVNVICTGIATFLSVIGVGFAGKALYSVISKLFGKGYQFASVFAKVADKTADVSAILTTIQYLLGSGQLTTTLLDCLAGVSWWNMAWTVACIVFNVVSLFATGGAALAVLVVNLVINIGSFIYVVSQRPDGC